MEAEPAALREGARSGSEPGRRTVVAAVLVGVTLGVVAVYWPLLTTAFGFDEQWRARRISLPQGFWTGIGDAEAPSSFAWLALERGAVALFGSSELTLRLTTVVGGLLLLGVATYRLTARVAPSPWPLVVAGLVMVNASLLVYGLILKPYLMEAAAAGAAVELWLVAQARAGRRRIVACYAGITCLVLLATPLLFLLPGLLSSEVVRARRAPRDEWRLRVAMAAVVGLVGLVHYAAFLAPQSRAVTGDPYFTANYAPFDNGLRATARFVWESGLWFLRLPTSTGFLPPDIFKEGENAALSAALWPSLARIAMAGVAVALVAGIAVALHRRDLRPVAVAGAIALALQLAASSRERWPFGANRTNLFLLPFIAVLAAAGVAAVVRRARHRVPLAVVAALVTAALLVALPLQGGRLAQLRRDKAGTPLFVGLRDAVTQVRRAAGPTDVVVLSGPPRAPVGTYAGWDYYMHLYDGLPADARRRPAVPRARTLLVTDPYAPLRAFLADHPAPARIYLFELWNAQRTERSVAALRRLQGDGWCETRRTLVRATGLLLELRPDCPRPAP